ncbi:Uncharacterized protein BTT61001_03002 [Bacillus thuringiensis]|uniref:Group-specific protein n=2 Tax=Bacillus cereus group TaxID=86661 RepID=A0A1C4EA37_BACTU|nr:hypothetical protein BK729_09900 [Bacillus thuringiensis serovar wratislaviensis]OUB61895.1 hypothetical protein BK743_07140 [Bacillus thuringiensis serovar sylvestriensis]PRT33856.1 hypothetical protein C6357_31065 [Bacillus wiedmannii]TXR62602.1 hypothetical protein DM800_20185 [Bacillus sp. AY18-3]SCC40332.1 Uncharacterized protein BTT61001_03002 [Bacillus thuringiensis]
MIIFLLILFLCGYVILKYSNMSPSSYFTYFLTAFIIIGVSILILKLDVKPQIKYTIFGFSLFVLLHNLVIGAKMLFK